MHIFHIYMKTHRPHPLGWTAMCAWLIAGAAGTIALGQSGKVVSSYGPINQDTTFDQIKEARITSWSQLDALAPDQIRERGLFPYKALPFADHAEGGMLFPEMITKLLPRLLRFDLDFDLPEHILPDAAPAIYLTTRPDLGDVAKGRLITIDNYYEIFNGLLNPKQLEGLRLLVTQFPQQQFNATEDRRTDRPSLGVTCFDNLVQQLHLTTPEKQDLVAFLRVL